MKLDGNKNEGNCRNIINSVRTPYNAIKMKYDPSM